LVTFAIDATSTTNETGTKKWLTSARTRPASAYGGSPPTKRWRRPRQGTPALPSAVLDDADVTENLLETRRQLRQLVQRSGLAANLSPMPAGNVVDELDLFVLDGRQPTLQTVDWVDGLSTRELIGPVLLQGANDCFLLITFFINAFAALTILTDSYSVI